MTDTTATTHTTLEEEPYHTPSSEHIDLHHDDEIDLSGLSISPSHSTPRPATKELSKQDRTTSGFAQNPSPYEALRQEYSVAGDGPDTARDDTAPITPGKTASVLRGHSNHVAMTPESSPFLPPTAASLARPSTSKKRNADPLLHRVLDRNYRVQATPMTTARTRTLNVRPTNATTTPATTRKLFDTIASSSPDTPAAPELHAEIFSSPMRRIPPSARKPRTPCVSVLTPAKGTGENSRSAGTWDSDDGLEDEDEGLSHSPPKTMQFHVPQSRLLRTPGTCFPIGLAEPVANCLFQAQEASKRIVEDLLLTSVGGDDFK